MINPNVRIGIHIQRVENGFFVKADVDRDDPTHTWIANNESELMGLALSAVKTAISDFLARADT